MRISAIQFSVLFIPFIFTGPVLAQVPVVEAGSSSARGNQPGASNELVVSLYNQLETLQSEVQTLRGLVEEQGYLLQRLQTESKDRYLDVDRRLSEVTIGAVGVTPVLPGSVTPPHGGCGCRYCRGDRQSE